jgi:hypothetical protein
MLKTDTQIESIKTLITTDGCFFFLVWFGFLYSKRGWMEAGYNFCSRNRSAHGVRLGVFVIEWFLFQRLSFKLTPVTRELIVSFSNMI